MTSDDDSRSAESLPTGWIALAQSHWTSELTASVPWVVFVPVFIGNAASFLADGLPFGLRLLAWLGASIAAFFGFIRWRRYRHKPGANFVTDQFSVGRRTMPMSDIRWARLLVTETEKSRSITLQFGPGALRVSSDLRLPRHATYTVRSARGWTPPADEARLIAEVLRRSSIELPQTPEDPTGKFTWFNFPGSLTKDQAVEIVLNPPAFGDPIPVPPSHMFDPKRPKSRRATNT